MARLVMDISRERHFTKFELVINLATPRTLGMDVPLSLILRVDEMLD